MSKAKRIWFIYAEAVGHSGQFEASRILIEANRQKNRAVKEVVFPALVRSGGYLVPMARYVCRLFYAWGQCLPLLRRPHDPVHINVGQTPTSIFRDFVAILICRTLSDRRIGLALHGNSFCGWPNPSVTRRLFVFLLNRATTVTVLSAKQMDVLKSFGVTVPISIVPNACDASVESVERVRQKHIAAGRVNVLHLSSLIDTKGYPEFMRALSIISAEGSCLVDGILCGSYVGSQYAQRFHSRVEAETWIRAIAKEIDERGAISFRWIDGAYGQDKWKLFNEAHIFVFPSVYSVEAQPIVLLEALACGVVCISTDVGDIGTILGDGDYLRLAHDGGVSLAEQIAVYIKQLCRDPELRVDMAIKGLRKYESSFSKTAYVQRWEGILGVNGGIGCAESVCR